MLFLQYIPDHTSFRPRVLESDSSKIWGYYGGGKILGEGVDG